MTVTGNFGDIQIGASYGLKVAERTSRYGVQFVATNYHRQALVQYQA